MNQLPLYEVGKLIFIRAITPVHVGIGRVYGEAVDLPIQRDEFGLPVIWGSSLKGAIRSQRELSIDRLENDRSKNEKKRILRAVFGPDDSEESKGIDTASSMSVLDARLVLIPARALRGLYVYVTSSHLLRYYLNYVMILLECTLSHYSKLEEIERSLSSLVDKLDVDESRAIALSDRYVMNVGGRRNIVINEQVLDVDVRTGLERDFERCLVTDKGPLSREELSRVVVVSDSDIDDIVRRSLQVITRVKLDYDKKVVKQGALWSEEYVPANTIFVGAILYSRPRMLKLCAEIGSRENIDESIKQVCKILKDYDDVGIIWRDIISPGEYLILGGHETIGKGIVKVMDL
ncbi:MAG: type III-B CRISPR module RAMP protein Cmr4 [Crenarchaeota archaeon]|nr:type III-B CRISPR module RAMP protein Cmr4 [Thermoproteota archaeon]